jgi:CRP/FNR family transcriptional regulator
MKKHSAVACISRTDLFSSLSSDDLKKIAAISTHQEYFQEIQLFVSQATVRKA